MANTQVESKQKETRGDAIEKKPRFKPYSVKVSVSALRIRKDAGTDKEIVGLITGGEVHTIIKEANAEGAAKWGKLENGTGWISLDHTTKI